MNILFMVSTPGAGEILSQMVRACQRKGVSWGVFFTNDGVKVVSHDAVKDLLHCAGEAFVCEHSWQREMQDMPCPVGLGSQTQNSMLAGKAEHIISL